MRIRQLSDIHLETGPFTYEDQGEDVVVLAGDISVGTAGIEWAKTIPKPVIYVSGNHEHWGQDIYVNLKSMRLAAKGSNVHFLENEAVNLTINGETVRFLGCTLWTDYGEAHCKNHPVVLHEQNPQLELMEHAMGIMRDFDKVTANSWWTPENEKRCVKTFHVSFKDVKDFNPLVAYDMHQKNRAWLSSKLAEECDVKTVVVTHHAPSYTSLLQAKMISDFELEQQHWRASHRAEGGLHRVAAYASDLESFMGRSSWRGSGIDLWLHGHTHARIQYAMAGTVVSCNTRGYHEKPFTKKEIEVYALSGYSVSAESIKRSEKAFAENPERGETFNFDRNLVIDMDTMLAELVIQNARKMLEDLPPILEDVLIHQPYLARKDNVVVSLAGEHIAKQSHNFNHAVRGILDYLDGALRKNKGYSTEMESNFQCAESLGLTENHSQNFRADERFWIIDPFGRKPNPKKWGDDVASAMTGTISEFDERLDQCVRDLSDGKVNITIVKSAF